MDSQRHSENPRTISGLLARHQGVVLADNHDNPHITSYLVRQAANFKKAGVKICFMEMFDQSVSCQEMLSAFNQTGKVTHEMKQWFDKNWPYKPRTTEDWIQLIKAMHKNGIEIVGIDPENRHSLKPVEHSTQEWSRVIKRRMKDDKTTHYLVFGGKLHTHVASRYSDDMSVDWTEGVDKMLGIPCVVFQGKLPASKRHAFLQRDGRGDSRQLTYNLAIPDRVKDQTSILSA